VFLWIGGAAANVDRGYLTLPRFAGTLARHDPPVDHTVHERFPNPTTRRLLPLFMALNRRMHDPKKCSENDSFVSLSPNFHIYDVLMPMRLTIDTWRYPFHVMARLARAMT
jgi:hypothetical protein